MKFLYRSFWTLSIMSGMLFLYILKNIQSTGFEIACRFFRCTISTDCNFSCETSKSWLYQWMFWDWMCWSEVCISDMLDFYDRLYYRYTNPVLGQFCSIFCFAVSIRNDVFSSNADPFRVPFLRGQNGWGDLYQDH